MNTATHTNKNHNTKKSKATSRTPIHTDPARSKDTVRADELRSRDQYRPPKEGFGDDFLPIEARTEFDTTVANKGPAYMKETWREFAEGRVTEDHKKLVRKHCKLVGIPENIFDQLIDRDPQNIQLLAQLI